MPPGKGSGDHTSAAVAKQATCLHGLNFTCFRVVCWVTSHSNTAVGRWGNGTALRKQRNARWLLWEQHEALRKEEVKIPLFAQTFIRAFLMLTTCFLILSSVVTKISWLTYSIKDAKKCNLTISGRHDWLIYLSFTWMENKLALFFGQPVWLVLSPAWYRVGNHKYFKVFFNVAFRWWQRTLQRPSFGDRFNFGTVSSAWNSANQLAPNLCWGDVIPT